MAKNIVGTVSQVLGAVAGYDPHIVATQSAGQARELLRLFENLAGRR